MHPPTVSVVIPTHGRGSFLPTVLAPLLADPMVEQVVVVVDGDCDGSLDQLRRLAAAEPRVLPLGIARQGENAARQAGVERATGEVVLLIDDDVVALPGLVSGHARRHAEDHHRVVAGYMPVVRASAARPSFAACLYSEAYEARCSAYERDSSALLRNLWAGNLSLRRADCLAVGLADGGFTGGFHADRDLGLRCLKAGLVGVFDRSLRAQHHYRRGLAGFTTEARSQGTARVILHQRHRDLLGPLDVDRCFAEGLPSAAAALVRACRRPRIRRATVAALIGALRGLEVLCRPRLQLPFARLLRRIEQQRGALLVIPARSGPTAWR